MPKDRDDSVPLGLRPDRFRLFIYIVEENCFLSSWIRSHFLTRTLFPTVSSRCRIANTRSLMTVPAAEILVSDPRLVHLGCNAGLS
jgi:hypothetical protein